MKVKLKLARVGMNMEEATIARWLKQPGEHFDQGEGLYEIETEKVSMTVEAPTAGTLLEILVAGGQNAAVGQEVCVVDSQPAAAAAHT
jgi:pyruvate/2-oxoglutarate dehydrogenase complex dihydrolipoamide acyltransferase (E2) component